MCTLVLQVEVLFFPLYDPVRQAGLKKGLPRKQYSGHFAKFEKQRQHLQMELTFFFIITSPPLIAQVFSPLLKKKEISLFITRIILPAKKSAKY